MENIWKEIEARGGGVGAVLAEANRQGWNAWIAIAAEALMAGARREQIETLFEWALEGYPEATAAYLRELWEAA
jgi:hypothetical protein